ncbi:MAG: bacterial transcriptional activator domain-containing protein [Anaerolineae bacterium]|nr:bacterial transcriptional activator domain-containing protein [Anaerolineae bacterium]
MQNTAKLYYQTSFPASARLIILHPNFESQHLLLIDILSRGHSPLIVTLQTPGSGLVELWQLLSDVLVDSGSKPLEALTDKTTVEKAAQITLKALKPLEPVTLVLDAFDCLQGDAVAEWLIQVAAGLRGESQIVLGTRRLPVDVLKAAADTPALTGKVALYPTDDSRMLIDYLVLPADHKLLEVYAHGPGQAFVNGRMIEQWDGVLPRSLFFYLVDRGMTTRDEIFRTFWPELNVREATNVFHVTKRKVSEILGFDLTVYWSGFYRISSDIDLQYDVVRFGEYVQNSAVADDDEAMLMLQNAIHLYRGRFLSTMNAPWIETRGEDLRSTYIDALSSLAHLYEKHSEWPSALGLYQRATAIQPHREDLVRGIMQMYKELGQPERAVAAFDRLATSLKRDLSVNPDKRTVELLDQIRVKPSRKGD